MSLLRYTHKETPPDKWRWKCPHTGHRIEDMNRATWLKKIAKFNADNGFTLEPGWEARVEHEFCMLLPPGNCHYEDGSTTKSHLNTRTTAETIAAGTKVFLAWLAEGRPRVAPEVAEERAKTCAACFAAVPITGCGGCAGIIGIIMETVGSGKTSADEQLRTQSCAWCGCSALGNVWMPVEVSERGVTNDMLAPDASPEWCWKSREIRALRGL